jgi:LSD1 subclass zinc finger protein
VSEEPRKFVVHGLEPMTARELRAIPCGHCRHPLVYHNTLGSGHTQCAFCHCLRHPGEDIKKPHDFGERP